MTLQRSLSPPDYLELALADYLEFEMASVALSLPLVESAPLPLPVNPLY